MLLPSLYNANANSEGSGAVCAVYAEASLLAHIFGSLFAFDHFTLTDVFANTTFQMNL